ncbi:MAG: GNAT family N-acetyltransferase [Nocardioides sp.]
MSVPRGCRIVVRRTAGTAAGSDPVRLVNGVRHAGESLLGASLRSLREEGLSGLEPWAVDLSGKVGVLAVDVPDASATDHLTQDSGDPAVARAVAVPDVRVGFRPMSRADLHDMVRWTAQPHVARWWDDGSTDLAAAEKHYGPAIDGADPTRMWVVEINGRSVGFVQDYLIGDHPEYSALTARPDAVGIDYAIGEPTWTGRGTGTRMLWHFLRDVVRPHYISAQTCFAAPDHANATSLRVLDKLGFDRGLWFDEPQAGGGVETMVGCELDLRRILGRKREQLPDSPHAVTAQ